MHVNAAKYFWILLRALGFKLDGDILDRLAALLKNMNYIVPRTAPRPIRTNSMGLGPGVRPSGPKAVPSTILCPLPDSPMNVRSSTHLMRAFIKPPTITNRQSPIIMRPK
jgi:hypothetical protein